MLLVHWQTWGSYWHWAPLCECCFSQGTALSPCYATQWDVIPLIKSQENPKNTNESEKYLTENSGLEFILKSGICTKSPFVANVYKTQVSKISHKLFTFFLYHLQSCWIREEMFALINWGPVVPGCFPALTLICCHPILILIYEILIY